MRIESDIGQGRAFLLLSEDKEYQPYASALQQALAAKARAIHIESQSVHAENWNALTDSLMRIFEKLSLRQASLIGFGAASALCQNLALMHPKLVRTLVLVDPSSRPHPNFVQRILDTLETKLPLGLPLRLKDKSFDSKPFLQRLRCPSLLAISPLASPYQIHQAKLMDQRMPTSWQLHLPPDEPMAALCEASLAFQGIPVKCPQKARKREMEQGSGLKNNS